MSKFWNSYHPYAITTIVFWSLAYVLTRLALQHFSANSIGILRYVIASCALIAFCVARGIKPPALRDWPLFALSGATGYAIYVTAFTTGSVTLNASTCSVVIATAPVITACLARVFLHERLSVLQWAAVVVEFVGIVVLTMIGGTLTVNSGILWLLLAALATGVYNILQRRLTASHSALQVTAYSMFVGTLLLAVNLPAAVPEALSAPAKHLVYVVVMGIFSSMVAYVCWTKAFEKATNTMSVSNYMFVTPILTTLLGFLMADERPDMATIVGGAIILSGLLLFNIAGRRKAAL